MDKRLSLTAVVVWLILVWALFLVYQQKPFVSEGHTGDYLISLTKVLAVLLVSTSLGMRITAAKPRIRDIVPACAVGLALLGMGTMALASLAAIKPYVIWVILALLAAISYRQVAALLRRLASASIPDLGAFETGIIAVMVFALLVCLINCLAPLTANDAMVYHLNVPKLYAADGGFVKIPYNVYANMPHNGEMLYTLFYSVAGETGAKLCYFFLVMAAVGAVYSLARRFVTRKPALIGTSIFLVQPLVIDHRTVCNVDVVLAYFYLAAAIVAFDMWRRRVDKRQLVVLSILAGFMLGVKYTAIAPCLTLLIIPLAGVPKRPSYKTVIAAIAIAVVIFVPWMIKNERFVGNPVYPLLETTFDGYNWDTVQESQLIDWQREMGMGRGVTDYLLLPLNISTKGKPGLNYMRFDGTMSPLLLMLVPLALFRRRRETNVLLIMVVIGLAFWALISQQLRFLIPSIALLAVLASIGLSNLSDHIGGKWLSPILVLVVLIQISTLMVSDQYRRPFLSNTFGDRLAAVTGLEASKPHLERAVQSFTMFDHINRSLPLHEPVFMMWENRGYYLERPYFADSFFEASTLMRLVAESKDAETLKRTIKRLGYRYVLVNDLLGAFFSKRYPPQDLAVLADLVTNHLEPLHTTNRITLYTIP